jgi:pimeloyl-ACP methyl ester carboxylesterase
MLLAFALFGCRIQDRFLYYPDPFVPSEREVAAAGLRFWPAPPPRHRGFVGTAKIERPTGAVVVFHGNAGAAAHRAYYVAVLEPLGYRVVLAEYPGYGGRPGRPTEEALVGDARETVRLAASEFGPPLVLLGESLGCGVAAGVVKDSPYAVSGLVLVTPWDSLLAVARAKFPRVPLGWLLSDAYDTVENLKDYRGRVGVVGARRDEIVPLRHAQALHEALPGPKRLWVLERSGHNDWIAEATPRWWAEVMAFVVKE